MASAGAQEPTRKAKRAAIYDAIDALTRVSELVERRRRQLARGVGLSDQQWRVLEGIHSEHFLPSLYARESKTSPAAISRTLRLLSERGLVRATISSEDARQRSYGLTAKGLRTIEQLRAAREEALEVVWAPFSQRELASFTQTAEKLALGLDAYAAEVEER